MRDEEIAGLEVNDETMRLVVLGLAAEVQEFALSRGIAGSTVEAQLELILREFEGDLGGLLDIREVPAVGATDIAALSVRFSAEHYRRLASAAKDRVAGTLDVDAGGIVGH